MATFFFFILSGTYIPDEVLSSRIICLSPFLTSPAIVDVDRVSKWRLGKFLQKSFFWAHQSEYNQVWVTTLGRGRDVKLRRQCQSCAWKCVKMVDLVNVWDNCINSFKNLPLQTNQSECYQIWVTFGQGPDKLQVQWSNLCCLVSRLMEKLEHWMDQAATEQKDG